MSKGKIIGLSILIFIVTLITVLFGVVFCLRKQSVVVIGEDVGVTSEEILKTAELKEGTPIFMLNKEEAINKIEKTHPYIKVIQIKTTNVMEVEIVVRKRIKMYSAHVNNKYYVLDEDLKVLNIFETEQTNLIKIEDSLQINNNIKEGDFVGSKFQQEIASSLFESMFENAVNESGEHLNREEICGEVNEIVFENNNNQNKLIVKTANDISFEIWKPEDNLGEKINICYVLKYSEQIENLSKITIFYDEYGTMQVSYQSV